MGKIDELIKQMCPEGVKWVTLGDVFHVQNGYTPSKTNKEFWEDGSIPWFRLEDIRTNGRCLSDAIQHITPLAVKKSGLFKKGSIIISTTATIGEYALVECDFICNQQITCLTPISTDVYSRFYLHYGAIIGEWCRQNVNGPGLSILPTSKLKDIEIPLPPLPIQEAIVEILDKFDRLSAELQAELQARKTQYEYYRNQLLTRFAPDQQVKEYSLGELGDIRMCKRILKHQTNSEGGVPFYKIGSFGGDADAYINEELFQEYKSKYSYPKKGDILISAAGTIGKGVIFDGKPSYFQDSNIVWIDNDESKVLNMYLFHLYKIIKWKIDDGGVIKRLYNENIRSAKIQVPSLSEQTRIVSILDKFEALVNDLSQGLPAEIAAVKEQYEYYRNKLLTF